MSRPLPSIRAGAVSSLFAAFVAIATVATLPQAARAQSGNFTLGGDARAFAMGGAGLAVPEERSGNRVNPASLAFENKEFGFHFPSFGYRSQNIDSGEATSFISDGAKLGDANSILQKYAATSGGNDALFGVNANASLRLGKFEVSGLAVAKATLTPNATFKEWAASPEGLSGLLSPQYSNSRVDMIGAGYYALPAVSMASTLPVKPGTFYNYGVGIRAKWMKGFYSHYIGDDFALTGQQDALLAPEMDGQHYLEKTGFGADLGFLAKPRHNAGFSYAVLASNLIKPDFKFQGTDKDGNPFAYDLIKTTYSSGVAWQNKSTTIAADVDDLTSADGPKSLRTGLEERFFGNKLAIRGGYNSTTGFTYGAGLLGFDVAFGSKVPLEVVKTLNF